MNKIVKKVPLKLQLVVKWLPDFYKKIPEYDEGVYFGEVRVLTPELGIVISALTQRKRFSDSQSAYYWARWKAFKMDKFSLTIPQSCGIMWQIKK